MCDKNADFFSSLGCRLTRQRPRRTMRMSSRCSSMSMAASSPTRTRWRRSSPRSRRPRNGPRKQSERRNGKRRAKNTARRKVKRRSATSRSHVIRMPMTMGPARARKRMRLRKGRSHSPLIPARTPNRIAAVATATPRTAACPSSSPLDASKVFWRSAFLSRYF